jgi:hypothetical protein
LLSTSNTLKTLSLPVATFYSKLHKFMDQHSWNTTRVRMKSMVYMQLTVAPIKVAKLMAAWAGHGQQTHGDKMSHGNDGTRSDHGSGNGRMWIWTRAYMDWVALDSMAH